MAVFGPPFIVNVIVLWNDFDKMFNNILKFVSLIQKFREVERTILVKGKDRLENDHEHTYALTMLAWYINNTYNLGLNEEKLFKYALAHDLVEVYAGDVHFFDQDEQATAAKHERERVAAERIKAEFPDFPEIHEAIAGYELREDKESKFVYALDKVEPVLNIYIDGGRTWKRNKVTLDMLKSKKFDKVAVDPTVQKIFHELISRLEAEHDKLFETR